MIRLPETTDAGYGIIVHSLRSGTATRHLENPLFWVFPDQIFVVIGDR